MNGITILIWITIAIIGIIAIILVKLHYSGDKLENDEGSIIPGRGALDGILSQGKEKIDSTTKNHSLSHNKTTQNTKSLYGNRPRTAPDYDVYIVPEEYENMRRIEYESENQVLINYGNEVQKFQEPIKQSQMDIMNQNNEDKTELKDLFTIDELIKESKRKDNEREKESQKISREEDAELDEIKQSIKQRKENKVEEPLIEEVISESESVEDIAKEDSSIGIAEAIAEEEKVEEVKEEAQPEVEIPQTSQKDIEEAITSASEESEEEIVSISEDENITDALLSTDDDDELDIPNEEIKKPTLKTPNKVDKTKAEEYATPIEDDKNMDLDYRKDLDRFTNKITGSKIFQDVKEKLVPETEEITPKDDESYIRSVNVYDEYEPIINETHVDYGNMHDNADQKLRQENTRRVFNMAKKSPEPETAQAKIGDIKDKPVRENIKVTIGNAEFVVKKGDEIIFNHMGETYSSQVYAITGDDIHVRYRRKDITIKAEDIKKVY